VRAVEALARGEALLEPRLTRRVIAELVARPEPVCPRPHLLAELSARERKVVALVGHSLSNDEIAERLVVSPATARTHVGPRQRQARRRATEPSSSCSPTRRDWCSRVSRRQHRAA
jgi:DNA-binding CsgD family transcriptional regulator